MLPQPAVRGIAAATASPRMYGFHATLRPPMRLATGWDEFMATAEAIARQTAPFPLPALEVACEGGFVMLRQVAPSPALHAFAESCVAVTDIHRLRAGETELARRRAAGLSAAQEAMLLRWGYPYVMAEWRLHMTLTGMIGADGARFKAAAERHFRDALPVRRLVQSLCVFTQAEDGAPMLIAERLALGGQGALQPRR